MTFKDRPARFTVSFLAGCCFIIIASAALPAADGRDGRIPFPRPDTHAGNWTAYHGKEVLAGGNSPGSPGECLTCHQANDCAACHATTLPRDHNNFWRTRGHGLAGRGDRERCAVCHRQDYCIRCHAETPPRSHTAAWRTRHCTWCHLDGNAAPAENCRVCHKAALHRSAPHPVNPGINCLQCHR